MSAYNDKNISLKNIALTQFELAREVPAAIDLFANKPQMLDIQLRTIITKINAVLNNFRKKNNFVLAIAVESLGFLNPMFKFLHGDKDEKVTIYSWDPSITMKNTKFDSEIISKIDKQNIFKTETEIVRNALKNEGFFIVVVSSHSVNEARECIDAFSMGKEGVLFIHNYAHEKSPSHHLYAVERGLRIIELPDGSGECYHSL